MQPRVRFRQCISVGLFGLGISGLFLSAHAQRGMTKPIFSATPQQTAQPQGTAAPAQASSGIPSGPATDTTYILSVGDTIQVTVWKEPNASAPSVPIRPDGMISLGLIGDEKAAGLTPKDLADDIAKRLKQYITDPRVTVTLLGTQAKEIYVLGEVLHVGPITYSPDKDPLQAISDAGGLTAYAKSTKIYILRKEAGKQKKIPFDYKKAIKSGDLQGVTLLPGDTIVVP